MSTEEGNKLIAVFMGMIRKEPDSEYRLHQWWEETLLGSFFVGYDHSLKYHISWNKLMPVVEKIERIHDDFHGYFAVYIGSNNCTIQGTNFRCDGEGVYFNSITLDTKIESTWRMVVNFIKWHNTKLQCAKP